jgi:hypothetical protein
VCGRRFEGFQRAARLVIPQLRRPTHNAHSLTFTPRRNQ